MCFSTGSPRSGVHVCVCVATCPLAPRETAKRIVDIKTVGVCELPSLPVPSSDGIFITLFGFLGSVTQSLWTCFLRPSWPLDLWSCPFFLTSLPPWLTVPAGASLSPSNGPRASPSQDTYLCCSPPMSHHTFSSFRSQLECHLLTQVFVPPSPESKLSFHSLSIPLSPLHIMLPWHAFVVHR